MTTDWTRKPTLCKAATEWRHEGFSVSEHEKSPGTITITQKQSCFSYLAIYSSTCMCTACCKYLICVHNLNRGL